MQCEKGSQLTDIVAIDGPAGSGKSTAARLVAKKIGYAYVDTGAMYRALTLKALRESVDFNDEKSLIELSDAAQIDIRSKVSGDIEVMLDGEDVASLIRTPELTECVAYIAKIPRIREKMKHAQRGIGMRGRAVFEGRDIGTVVFPEAAHKFYIDADFDERVRRRHKELVANGPVVSYEDVSRDLSARDHKDLTRSIGPLKAADDAVRIDTTHMTIDEVVDKIVSLIA
jgi:CMP/dCMP kinase